MILGPWAAFWRGWYPDDVMFLDVGNFRSLSRGLVLQIEPITKAQGFNLPQLGNLHQIPESSCDLVKTWSCTRHGIPWRNHVTSLPAHQSNTLLICVLYNIKTDQCK